jgi:hypothetical protein
VRIDLPDMPPLSGAMGSLPGGRETIPATMMEMWKKIADPDSQMAVYTTARHLVKNIPQKALMMEAQALFNFAQKNIRYTRDPYQIEALQTPAATLQLKTGDCDDKTILLAALLLSIGIPVKLIVGGWTKGRYSHVWLRAGIRNCWVSMDATEPHPMGWEPHMPSRMIMPRPKL